MFWLLTHGRKLKRPAPGQAGQQLCPSLELHGSQAPQQQPQRFGKEAPRKTENRNPSSTQRVSIFDPTGFVPFFFFWGGGGFFFGGVCFVFSGGGPFCLGGRGLLAPWSNNPTRCTPKQVGESCVTFGVVAINFRVLQPPTKNEQNQKTKQPLRTCKQQ